MMKLRLFLLFFLAFVTSNAMAQTPAPTSVTPPSGPLHVVTYFEVTPASAGQAADLLKQFAAASRKESGNVEFAPLREIGRDNRFAMVEAWQDKNAFEAHGAAQKALADKLQADFLSPLDARQFWTLAVAPATGDIGAATLVVTHVDVFPAGKDQVAALIKQLVENSRKDPGALRFDAVVQDGRPNHFHLVEAWNTRANRDAHAAAPHTREFRAKLVPFEGALYDERLFEIVR